MWTGGRQPAVVDPPAAPEVLDELDAAAGAGAEEPFDDPPDDDGLSDDDPPVDAVSDADEVVRLSVR